GDTGLLLEGLPVTAAVGRELEVLLRGVDVRGPSERLEADVWEHVSPGLHRAAEDAVLELAMTEMRREGQAVRSCAHDRHLRRRIGFHAISPCADWKIEQRMRPGSTGAGPSPTSLTTATPRPG